MLSSGPTILGVDVIWVATLLSAVATFAVMLAIYAATTVRDPMARRVLRAASVFGDRFSKDGLAALLGGERHADEAGEWLKTLASRELVGPASIAVGSADPQFAFRHAIVQTGPTSWLPPLPGATGETLSLSNNGMFVNSSVGVGLLWASPFGPLRFDLAYPVTKQSFDRTQIFRFSGGTVF